MFGEKSHKQNVIETLFTQMFYTWHWNWFEFNFHESYENLIYDFLIDIGNPEFEV